MKVQLKSTDGTENLYPVTAANSVIFPDGNNLEAKFPELVGKSAYQSWLDAGHTGTESDFLASLQGNSGYTGAAGELEVVNNLTGGGATAALSAEMGKQLKNLLDSIRLGKGQDGLVYIFVAGNAQGYGLDPSTGEIVIPEIYGDVISDSSQLNIAYDSSVTLAIKLSKRPSKNQSVRLISMSEYMTVSESSLVFTEGNWDEWQTVTITNTFDNIGKIETSLVIQNSDPYLTDTTIPISISGLSYEDVVDTSIPSGAHTIAAEDFGTVTPSGSSILLKNYNAGYANIYVPQYITYEGVQKKVRLAGGSSFKNNATLQYVEIESGVGVNEYGTSDTAADWRSLFSGCSELLGVRYSGSNITNLSNTFLNCGKLRFFDGLDQQVSCTTLYMTFSGCSAIEYIQDISELTAVSNLQSTFADCASLVKIIGMMPSVDSQSCTMNSCFSNCTLLTEATIPLGVTDLFYTFRSCTSLRRVDCLATATFTRTTNAFANCTNLYVYCIAGSEAYTKLVTDFGSSSSVHIVTESGGELPNIVVWGDSTSSPNTQWREWPLRLMDLVSGFNLKNQAVSGEYTTSTSARQGGNEISVSAFEIPTTSDNTPVTISSKDGQVFGSSPVFSGGGGFNPCKIGGVDGYLTTSNGATFFKRKQTGSAVQVPADSIVVSNNDGLYNNSEAIMLIQIGDNSGWNESPAVLLNQIKMMVKHFTDLGGTKYIISGPWSGKYLRTAFGVSNVRDFEALAEEEFDTHWFSLRQYLIVNGLTQNNLTPSSTDTDRIAAGQVPGSLLGGGSTSNILMYPSTSSDDTHPNAYGANSMALGYYEKGRSLGYWN